MSRCCGVVGDGAGAASTDTDWPKLANDWYGYAVGDVASVAAVEWSWLEPLWLGPAVWPGGEEPSVATFGVDRKMVAVAV